MGTRPTRSAKKNLFIAVQMKTPKVLKIAQLGNSVIRQKAKSVKNIQRPATQKLVDDLIATCKAFNGVGIAAPQVSKSLRIFIIWSHPNARYPKAPHMKPLAMINPQLLKHSKKVKKDWEGCLSIPGIRALVPRYTSVSIRYTDTDGKKRSTLIINKFIARIFQHELDHLNGIVFLDRAESKDMITEREYQKLMA